MDKIKTELGKIKEYAKAGVERVFMGHFSLFSRVPTKSVRNYLRMVAAGFIFIVFVALYLKLKR